MAFLTLVMSSMARCLGGRISSMRSLSIVMLMMVVASLLSEGAHAFFNRASSASPRSLDDASTSVQRGVYVCERKNGPFCPTGPYKSTQGVIQKKISVREKDDASIFYTNEAVDAAKKANTTLPIIARINPLYDKTLDEWNANDMRLIQHLTSFGFAVYTTTKVPRMGIFPGPERMYPKELFWDLGDHTLEGIKKISEMVSSSSDDDDILSMLDASRVGVIGYSVGGSLTLRMTMEAQQQGKPVLAAVALGPTIGSERSEGGTGGRDIFTQGDGTSLVRSTLLLLAGDDDDRGGIDGVNTAFQRFVNAPRIKALINGATHCFVSVRGAGCQNGPLGRCRECETVSVQGDTVPNVGDGCKGKCVDTDLRTQAAARQMATALFVLKLYPDGSTVPPELAKYRKAAPTFVWGPAFEGSSPAKLSAVVQKDEPNPVSIKLDE